MFDYHAYYSAQLTHYTGKPGLQAHYRAMLAQPLPAPRRYRNPDLAPPVPGFAKLLAGIAQGPAPLGGTRGPA